MEDTDEARRVGSLPDSSVIVIDMADMDLQVSLLRKIPKMNTTQ